MAKEKVLHSASWLGSHANIFAKPDKKDDKGMALDKRTISFERIVRLASAKKAVTNFVRIVTNKQIPVTFDTGANRGGTRASINATDGERVFIGANITDKNFDAFVGIALHEASHIKYSQALFKFGKDFVRSPELFISNSLLTASGNKGYTIRDIASIMQMLLNLIEDRRIDKLLYNAAPGYKPYYTAMYGEFWLSKEIDKMLKDPTYNTEPTIENYLDRLIQFVNPHFNPSHMAGLKEMVEEIKVSDIDRLNSDSLMEYVTPESFVVGTDPTKYRLPAVYRVAEKVALILFQNVLPRVTIPNKRDASGQQIPQGPKGPWDRESDNEEYSDNDSDEFRPSPPSIPTTEQQEQPGSGGDGESLERESQDEEGQYKDHESEGTGANESEDSDQESKQESKQNDNLSPGGDEVTDRPETKEPEFSDEDAEALENAMSSEMLNPPKPKLIKISPARLAKALKNQKQFLNGQVKKAKLGHRDVEQVDILGAAQSSIHQVGESIFKGDCKCIITRKLTKELINSPHFTFGSNYESNENVEAIKNGFRIGNMLASRLAIRNEQQTLKFTRQSLGHIDKRLLAQIGAGVESIFTRTQTEQFKPVYVHLTIDASGSMSGEKWARSLTVAAALCVAADKVKNIDISVSLRAGSDGLAHIAFIYDSRKDKPTAITTLWKYLGVTSATPEGLTFEAIAEELLMNANGQTELYFINISDGEPSFSVRTWGKTGPGYESYSGMPAAKHTRQQVQRLEEAGFKIMSYFVKSDRYNPWGYRNTPVIDNPDSSDKQVFKASYGAAAEFINITEINSLTKTLNKLFLKRNN